MAETRRRESLDISLAMHVFGGHVVLPLRYRKCLKVKSVSSDSMSSEVLSAESSLVGGGSGHIEWLTEGWASSVLCMTLSDISCIHENTSAYLSL